jgi:penicillin V acylase-like amidase (Ntn superfamily)
MTVRTRVVAAALSVLSFAAAALPCTSFYIYAGGDAVVGKSFDWSTSAGLVVVNKRGIAKEAMVGDERPARWTSTYGSVTFNQYGRELPLGGMNEVGLVVEVLWLDESVYPAPDERPALGCLQWVQYMLDTCAAAAEAVATLEEVRVADDDTGRVHYFIADAAGGCAVVEFLDGKAVVSAGDVDMPARALANNTYDESLSFLSMYEQKEGTPDDIAGDGSLERFSRAAIAAAYFDSAPLDSATAADYAAGVLDDVASPDYSRWLIVYDVAEGRVYFRTRENMDPRRLEAAAFDYSPATPVKIFDMNAEGGGDVTEKFVDYTYEANRALVDASFAGTPFLRDVPEEVREGLARYPETTAPAEE